MVKNSKKLIFCVFLFISNEVLAFNSSSYLITHSAIKLFDYDAAYSEYSSSKIEYSENDLQNQLLVLTNLNLLTEANIIAKSLLDINRNNQEAWLIYLTNAKINNNLNSFSQYSKKIQTSLKLVDFIFFDEEKKIKKKEDIVKSIFEVIQATITKDKYKNNYDYVLFYLAIANFLDPYFYEGYFYSAQIYQSLNKYDRAEEFYNKIAVNHELYIDSQKNIAMNNNKIGLSLEAEKKLLKLIDIYPNKPDLILALADIYRIEKKYEKGIIYYTKLINQNGILHQEYWRLLYLRGICYERSSRWNLAEKDFLTSLQINNNSPEVLNYLAYGWLERDEKLEEAMEMLKKAYKSNSQSYYILDSLAWAYFKLSNYNKAAELMEQVVVMAPGEAISLDHLGDIYHAMDRRREAYFFWKQALDLATPLDAISDILKKKLSENNAG